MTAQFTPGPWTALLGEEQIVGGRGETVVWELGINEADAHLIAAAPDLYAACIEALDEDSGLACADQLRAAIIKAGGAA